MPNIKSAKKRVLVNAKKTEQNKAIRSAVKTEMKKVDLLIKENKLEEAKASLAAAFKAIDSACTKNIYHCMFQIALLLSYPASCVKSGSDNTEKSGLSLPVHIFC